jgi:hypothetical protein
MPKSKKVTKAEKKTQLKRRQPKKVKARRPYHRRATTVSTEEARVLGKPVHIAPPKQSKLVAIDRRYLELLEAKADLFDRFLDLDGYGLMDKAIKIEKMEYDLPADAIKIIDR